GGRKPRPIQGSSGYPMSTVDETLVNPSRVANPPRAPLGIVRAAASRGLARLRASTRAERVAYGFTATYALVFALLAVARHMAFQTRSFDLGIMTQALWSTVHGHFLQVTTLQGDQI